MTNTYLAAHSPTTYGCVCGWKPVSQETLKGEYYSHLADPALCDGPPDGSAAWTPGLLLDGSRVIPPSEVNRLMDRVRELELQEPRNVPWPEATS